MITLTSDYTGEYKIPKSCFDELTTYIAKYEEFYLVRLLGAELYDLFIADLTATSPQVPQTQRFIDIFEPFNIDNESCLHVSEGIRKMLVQFIYFHYIRDNQNFNTQTGTVRTDGSISTVTPYVGYNLSESYNQGVKNYWEIQWYICEFDEDYPEENIQELNLLSLI